MHLVEEKESIGNKLDSVIETLAELTEQVTDSKMLEKIAKALAEVVRARTLLKRVSEPSSMRPFKDPLDPLARE